MIQAMMKDLILSSKNPFDTEPDAKKESIVGQMGSAEEKASRQVSLPTIKTV